MPAALKTTGLSLTTTKTAVIAGVTGLQIAVTDLLVVNTGASARMPTLSFYSAVLGAEVPLPAPTAPLAAGSGVYRHPGNIFLQPGDEIRASIDAAGTVAVLASYTTTGAPTPLATGFNPRGVYSSSASYAVNDVVSYNGIGYVSSVAANVGNQPDTSLSSWTRLASNGSNGATGATGATGGTGATGATGAGGSSLNNTRSIAIQLAKLKGSTVLMAGGVADDFKDQSGYDTANSVNASYDATNNVIANAGVATAEDLAFMTSNSAPSGQTASATAEVNSSYQAYMAYDGSTGTWWAGSLGSGVSVQRTTTAGRAEAAYAITAPTGAVNLNENLRSWTRWGSNDGGTTKTVLDTQTAAPSWTQGERRLYTIAANKIGSYKTYGISVTETQGATNAAVGSLQGYLSQSGALDLRSVAFAAQAVPTKGSLFVLVKATADTITANTNLLAKLSRDGGTTYTTATLTSSGTYAGYTMYEANDFDISSQPSGSSMRWRLQTVGTALTVQVDAVVAEWAV